MRAPARPRICETQTQMLLLVAGVAATAAASAGRTVVSFDYNWRFHLGDPIGSKLTTASLDPTFDNITGFVCTKLAWSQLGRMAPGDCTGACSATAGCKAWQYATAVGQGGLPARGCFIHDGTLGGEPSCHPHPVDPEHGPAVGGFRATVPAPIQDQDGVTFKERAFDDRTWAAVDVPHDFILAGDGKDTTSVDYPYSESADRFHGYIPRDKAGWYRKHFTLPASFGEGGETWLHFEGVFQAVDVFLNGKHLLRHTSGYLGFDVPLHDTPEVNFGAGENILALRVDASYGSGHWYEGGGLQRRVWLMHTPGVTRFATDGLFAQTPEGRVTVDRATVVPSAEVSALKSDSVQIRYTLFDPVGATVAAGTTKPTPVGSSSSTQPPTIVAGVHLSVTKPKRWSVKTPQLYTLMAELTDSSGAVVDNLNTTIGLRSIDWSAPRFKLNEEPLHIRGFSHHSDFGAVGGAVPDRINLFRANALRSVGGNTWRTSHNPYRPAVYDILDATGILCWDENRDFNQMNGGDMEAMVRRDRNHPAVVMWSGCNEVECYVTGNANVTGKLMRDSAKKWDTTRPFTANQNQLAPGAYPDTIKYLSSELDVEGFSHGSIASNGAALVHAANPHKMIISGECCSCQTQRGEDFLNKSEGLMFPHAIDQAECMQRCMNITYPWWEQENPGGGVGQPGGGVGLIAGTLGVWTLFDYGGEPGPWPLVSSSFGQFDIAGFAKSASYWYRALWLAAVPEIDVGRPPLPKQHVVRISQSWQPPPPNATPRPTVPRDCDQEALAALCPADPRNPLGCVACLRNQTNVRRGGCVLPGLKCCGVGVWEAYCAGPTTSVGVQVFSDLPHIELFLNSESQGTAPCAPGGYAAFSLPKYISGNLTASGSMVVGGEVLAQHTVVTAGVAVAIELTVDVPSAATGTGNALLLDGHDTGLVRATIVDAEGLTVDASPLVEFEVESGPGMISGVHNGDAKSHEPQVATSRHAYHGLARAAIKVTHDAQSPELLQQLEVEQHQGVTLGEYNGVAEITVTASALGLRPGRVAIQVSSDVARHGVLQVAAASVKNALKFN